MFSVHRVFTAVCLCSADVTTIAQNYSEQVVSFALHPNVL